MAMREWGSPLSRLEPFRMKPGLRAERAKREIPLVSRIRSSSHFAAVSFANFGFERTLETYDSSVVLVRKFSWRTRGGNEENFRTTTLGTNLQDVFFWKAG